MPWYDGKFRKLPWVGDESSGSSLPWINQSGLVRCFDSRKGVTADSSNKVSQWDDQSTNADHATQGTSTKQFILTANVFGTNPGLLTASAALKNMQFTAVSGLTQFSSFIVIQPLIIGSYQMMLTGTVGNVPRIMESGFSNPSRDYISVYDGAVHGNDFFIPSCVIGAKRVFSIRSTASPVTAKLRDNGTDISSLGATGTNWSMETDTIGALINANRYSDAYIGLILLYDSSFSDADTIATEALITAQGF